MEEFAHTSTGGDESAFRLRPDSSRSDRQLLRSARQGSQKAVDDLVERHWDRAYRIAFGVLGDAHAAEDVTQEAMLSLVTSVGRFDPYRPFSPWLHAIVTNKALDWARARARRAEDPASPLLEAGGIEAIREIDFGRDGTEPGGSPAASSADPALEVALAKLSPEHRAVIVLRFVAGYGPKETGKVLGIPTGTVGSRLRRALDQLQEELEAEDD